LDLDKVINNLEKIARRIRLQIVEMAYEAGPERRGHPGPALSIADLMTALFFHVMKIDPKNPGLQERDRFILSKDMQAWHSMLRWQSGDILIKIS